jgi:hypothetical protein
MIGGEIDYITSRQKINNSAGGGGGGQWWRKQGMESQLDRVCVGLQHGHRRGRYRK